MTSIMLTVTGARAKASVTGPLTSGMVGIPVTIEYDAAWDGLTKNLVCRCSPWGSDEGETRVILNVEKTATVAHEVMKSDMYLYLGIEGFSSDGTLVMPTTWAKCDKIQYGANTCEDPSTNPELSVWNQLQTEIEQIKRDAVTQEQLTDIQICAQSAVQAAERAAQARQAAEAAASAADTARSQAADAGQDAMRAADEAKNAETNAKTAEAEVLAAHNNTKLLTMHAEDAADRAEVAAQRAEQAADQAGGGNAGQNAALTAAQVDLLEDAFERMQWADEDGPRYAAQLIASLRGGAGGDTEEPEEPDTPRTLVSISAVYDGGNVPVGTAVSSLTGVTVTAHYSDGGTANVTGYTLSGTIVEGENTVTVTYMGKTATITVTGEAQSAEGRVLLHNWDASADDNSVDTVGGVKMWSHNGASITKDGYTLENGDDNFYFEEPLFAPNRSVEIDFGTVEHVPEVTFSVPFSWGAESHHRGGKYWCGWHKPSGKWFWMEIVGDYIPEAYIDQLTDPNIISGKTVKFVINATGNLSLYIDDAFISTAPFAVIDAPYFQLGKVTEGFSATTITAIRVYQEVAE